MEKTSKRLTLMESYFNMSRSFSWLNLTCLILGCLMFVVAGIWAMRRIKVSGLD